MEAGTLKLKSVASIFSFLIVVGLAVSIPLSAQEESPDAKHAKQFVITEFDAPGAGTGQFQGTQPLANNTRGEIVGSYTDANVVPHGFVRAVDGKITSFDAPGAGLGPGLDQGTIAQSINDSGVIAGQFQDPNGVFHGFVRTRAGKFTTFDAPGAGTGAFEGTLAFCINPKGETAGFFIDGNNVGHGFVRSSSGQITNFDPPDATGPIGTGVDVYT